MHGLDNFKIFSVYLLTLSVNQHRDGNCWKENKEKDVVGTDKTLSWHSDTCVEKLTKDKSVCS